MAGRGSWGRPADGPPPSGDSSGKSSFGSSSGRSSFGSSNGKSSFGSSSGKSSFGSSSGKSSFGSSNGKSSFGSSSGKSSFAGQGAQPRRRRKAEREAEDAAFGPVVGRSADLPPEPDEDAPGPWDTQDSGYADAAPGDAGRTGTGRSVAGRATTGGRGRSRRPRAEEGAAGETPSGEPAYDWSAPGEFAPAGPAPGEKRSGGSPDASDPLALARSIVLRQLTLAPRSRHQLAVKLAERGVPAEAAMAVLDRFEEVQLIDDAEFARMWVRSRSATRSLARSALKRELAEKGVDPALAEDALASISDDDERDAARELIHRKMRQGVDLSDRSARDKEVRRLVSMLARKGYAPGLAFALVKDALDGQGDALDGGDTPSG